MRDTTLSIELYRPVLKVDEEDIERIQEHLEIAKPSSTEHDRRKIFLFPGILKSYVITAFEIRQLHHYLGIVPSGRAIDSLATAVREIMPESTHNDIAVALTIPAPYPVRHKNKRTLLTIANAGLNERPLAKAALEKAYGRGSLPDQIWADEPYYEQVQLAKSNNSSQTDLVGDLRELLTAKSLLPDPIRLGSLVINRAR